MATILGTDAPNTLTGTTNADTLNAYMSADIVNAGAGNDVLIGDGIDSPIEGLGGLSGGFSYPSNPVTVPVSYLLFGFSVDMMVSQDTLAGGTGDDIYIANHGNVADLIVELAGEGTDTVRSLGDCTLTDHVENLELLDSQVQDGKVRTVFVLETTLNVPGLGVSGIGNSLDNRITGNARDNVLNGLAGADTLIGGFGNDILDGGVGADVMQGGVGNDTYYVDNNADQTLESTPANGTSPVQAIYRVNTLSDGAQTAGGSSGFGRLSADGKFVVFSSQATNPLGESSASNDIFLKNLITGQLTAMTTGGNTFLNAFSPVLSADGTRLAYASGYADQVSGDTNGLTDIMVRNLSTGTIVRANTDASGAQATGGGSSNPVFSANGDKIGFESSATNLVAGDTNVQQDLFVKTLSGNAIVRVNTNAAGEQATGGSSSGLSFSADGGKVIFTSSATNLVADDTNGQSDIFIKDLASGSITRVNTASDGSQAAGGASSSATLSADGTKVLFSSSATNLVSGDTNGQMDLFVKDLITGAVTRVNTTAGGLQAIGGSSSGASFSPDGTKVLFSSSATNLVAGDTNGLQDVFLKDLVSGAVYRLNTNDLNTQATGGGSSSASFSPDGTRVIFTSAAINLITGDSNGYDDVYVVELAGVDAGGTDTVRASVNHTLGNYLEHLELIEGSAALKGTGNSLANLITGNSGQNVLDGGAGRDTLVGGLGNDTYVIDRSDDVVIESAGGGWDVVNAYASYTLSAELDALNLKGVENINGVGNSRYNLINGNAGANILTGGMGYDTLRGGEGNDTYVQDSVDIIEELANEGTDTVQSLYSHTLGANLENLVLTGTANRMGTGNALSNVLIGNSGNNLLQGLDGHDLLDGGSGIDTLEGGLGNDTLRGGAGNDTYVYEAVDLIEELAYGGIDTVLSSYSYTLGAGLENLTLTGASNLTGTGNSLNNILIGNGGANTLIGGMGLDTLRGGVGNDIYVQDSVDVIAEQANEGTDTVLSSYSHALGANLENLTLTGSSNCSGTGNSLNNVLTGNSGANMLSGGLGNDTYICSRGMGADTLVENDATVGNTDVLSFQGDVAHGQLWFRQIGSDLEVSVIGTTDKATVKGWFASADNVVEEIHAGDGMVLEASEVDALVLAMAAFGTRPAGGATLTTEEQSALGGIIAANWS